MTFSRGHVRRLGYSPWCFASSRPYFPQCSFQQCQWIHTLGHLKCPGCGLYRWPSMSICYIRSKSNRSICYNIVQRRDGLTKFHKNQRGSGVKLPQTGSICRGMPQVSPCRIAINAPPPTGVMVIGTEGGHNCPIMFCKRMCLWQGFWRSDLWVEFLRHLTERTAVVEASNSERNSKFWGLRIFLRSLTFATITSKRMHGMNQAKAVDSRLYLLLHSYLLVIGPIHAVSTQPSRQHWRYSKISTAHAQDMLTLIWPMPQPEL